MRLEVAVRFFLSDVCSCHIALINIMRQVFSVFDCLASVPHDTGDSFFLSGVPMLLSVNQQHLVSNYLDTILFSNFTT